MATYVTSTADTGNIKRCTASYMIQPQVTNSNAVSKRQESDSTFS